MSVSFVARVLGLLACSLQSSPAEVIASTPDTCSQILDGVETAALIGKCATENRTIPPFKALSHDGAARSKEDLKGHPTVVWFFPVSGTPG